MIARASETDLFQNYAYFDESGLDDLACVAHLRLTSNLTEEGQARIDQFMLQKEHQADGEYSGSFNHSLRVGGLVLQASCGDIELTTIAALHDMGKARDDIRDLVVTPRFLNDKERVIMDRHAEYGYLDLKGCLVDSELEMFARFVARNHHTTRPWAIEDLKEELPWDYTVLTQVADRTDAILLDWEGRPYKADRMTREGLLRADGTLDMDKALQAILREDQQHFLGVDTRGIVEIGRKFMPDPAWIQQQVQAARAKATS